MRESCCAKQPQACSTPYHEQKTAPATKRAMLCNTAPVFAQGHTLRHDAEVQMRFNGKHWSNTTSYEGTVPCGFSKVPRLQLTQIRRIDFFSQALNPDTRVTRPGPTRPHKIGRLETLLQRCSYRAHKGRTPHCPEHLQPNLAHTTHDS